MRDLIKMLAGTAFLSVLLGLAMAEQRRTVPAALESGAQLVLLRLDVSDDVTIMLGDDFLTWHEFRRLDLARVRVQYLHLSFGRVKDIRLERR